MRTIKLNLSSNQARVHGNKRFRLLFNVIVKFKNKLQVDNNFSLTLFGSAGQQLRRFPVNQLEFLQGYRLSTSDLSEGVYFIQISSDKINQIFRIIKLN